MSCDAQLAFVTTGNFTSQATSAGRIFGGSAKLQLSPSAASGSSKTSSTSARTWPMRALGWLDMLATVAWLAYRVYQSTSSRNLV